MARKQTIEEGIEKLAQLVKRGFDDIATKQQLQLVVENLDLVRSDIHDIKLTLGPLVRQTIATERRVAELEKRVGRVERKVGLTR